MYRFFKDKAKRAFVVDACKKYQDVRDHFSCSVRRKKKQLESILPIEL